MRGILLILRRTALAFGLLALVLVIALAVATHTDRFREFAREKLVQTINDSIRATLSVGRLEGSIWGNVILRDVVVQYQDDEIVRVPQVKIAYSLLPLLWGRLQVFEVEGIEPFLLLERDAEGQWNIAEAFSSKQPKQEEPSALVVLLNSLLLREGSIDLRLSGPEPQTYSFKNVSLDSRMELQPKTISVEVKRIASSVTAPGLPPFTLDGALAYRSTDSTDTVDISALSLATGASRVKLSGKIADGATTQVQTRIAVEKLAPSDINRIVPAWPIKRDITGTIAIDGPVNSLAVELDLAAAGGKLAGDLRLDVAQELPRYQGVFDLANFDLRSLLERKDLAGILSANVKAAGVGFTVDAVDAQGTVRLQSAAVAGWELGHVLVEGRMRDRIADLTGNLKSRTGGASWQGKIELNDKPSYDLAVSVNDLDIRRVAGNGTQLEGNLNFKGTIKGSGFDPADMIARTDLQILPSTVGPVKIQQGTFRAALADQRIQISRGSLRTDDAMLAVKGDIGIDPKQNGKLEYHARSDNLTPWLALADQQGSGSAELSGHAAGNIEALQSQGNLKLNALRLGANGVKSGSINFVLRQLGTQSWPQGKMQVQFTGIQAGIHLQSLDGTVGLASSDPYEIRLALKALDEASRAHTLVAQVDYQPEVIVARLEKVALNLEDGLWQLSRPATVTRRGDNVDIDNLVLQNRAQQVAVNGRFAASGKQDLTVNIEGFPISTLSTFLPKQADMTGTLVLRARVTGTAMAPEIATSINLADATIAGQRYGGIVGSVTYRERRADLKLTIRQDATHTLTANGTLPLVLRWSPRFEAEAAGDMNVRVQSSALSIAFLNAFSGEAAQNITGNVSLDILAQGPITQPVVRGRFQLADGGATVKPLGVQLTAVSANGEVDGQNIVLHRISARSGEGQINGSGALALRNYQPENFKLSLSATRWPLIQTERYRATVAGKLDIHGPLAKPSLTGRIEVLNADVRPDLALLSRGKTPLERDPTIVIVQREKPREKPGAQAIKKPAPQKKESDSDLFKNAAIDVAVVMPNQVWIRHPDANIELSGKIRAVKQPGKEVALTGTVSVVRGWIAFEGRRFNLVRGTIEFRGDETIDPALDIVAQYRLPDYVVEVVVSGTLKKPVLTLRSDPMLEQADVLALLLFGKPLDDLDRTQQTTLQQSAVDLASGFAATTVGQAVTEALGLDRLGLDIGELNFTGGQVGFGRYIGDRTYVSISQDLSGEAGQEVTIEYRIGPDWKITTSTSTTGASGIGILWHKRY